MSVSAGLSRAIAAIRVGQGRMSSDRSLLVLLSGFALGTALLRLPSFFEPPWHADEGIFAAVAQSVVSGGQLYADAWEAKPPLFIYIYVAVAELFGAGVLPLRIATAVSALGTELALFFVAQRFMPRNHALAASLVLAVLLAVKRGQRSGDQSV